MKIIPGSWRHRYVAGVAILLIAAALIAGMTGCRDYTPPVIAIRDWYDLDAIRDNLHADYFLMNDLDSTTAGYEELASPTANQGKGWEPIGTEAEEFVGNFNGQGYEIRDLFIDRPDENNVGLFSSVCCWISLMRAIGIIEDIGVVNANVTGNESVGSLIGANSGTVRDSYSTGSMTGNESVGGLVGVNFAVVDNSYSIGSVTGNSCVGGLVGLNEHAVINSYSTGSVTGNSSVGGLVGRDYGTVSDSFWDTETSGQATSDGGTGKTTAEMMDIATFTDTATEGLDEPWDIIAVANPGTRNPSYIWNIVDDETYPFLSWQS